MNLDSDGVPRWAKWALSSALLTFAAALTIILSCLYDFWMGSKIGVSASALGLFWAFGLTILFRIATLIFFRKERAAFLAKDRL